MGPQTRIAQHHFTVVVTRKVMAAWVQYTLLRRKKRCLSKLADEQFKTYALPRWVSEDYICLWASSICTNLSLIRCGNLTIS